MVVLLHMVFAGMGGIQDGSLIHPSGASAVMAEVARAGGVSLSSHKSLQVGCQGFITNGGLKLVGLFTWSWFQNGKVEASSLLR